MEDSSFLNYEGLNGDITKLIESISNLESLGECNEDMGQSEFNENDFKLISYYSKYNKEYAATKDGTYKMEYENVTTIENGNNTACATIDNGECTGENNKEILEDDKKNEYSSTLYNTLINDDLIDNTELPKIRVRTDLFKPEFLPKPPVTGLSIISENFTYDNLKIVGREHFRRTLGRLDWSKVLFEDDHLQAFRNLLKEIEELEDLDEMKEHVAKSVTLALKRMKKMNRCKAKAEKFKQLELHAVQNINLRKYFRKSLKYWRNNREKMRKSIKKKKWCFVCQEEAKFYCCWQEYYCSVDCQKSAWSKHIWKCKQLAMKMVDPYIRVNAVIKDVLMNGFTPRNTLLINILRELIPSLTRTDPPNEDLSDCTEGHKVVSACKTDSTVNMNQRNCENNNKKRSIIDQFKSNKRINNYIQKKREWAADNYKLCKKSVLNFNENNYSSVPISGKYSRLQYLNTKYNKKNSDECNTKNLVDRTAQFRSIRLSSEPSGPSNGHNETSNSHQPTSDLNNKRYKHFLQIPIYKVKGKSDQLFLPSELAKQIQPHISKALLTRLNAPPTTMKSNQHLNKETMKLTLNKGIKLVANGKDIIMQKNKMNEIIPAPSNVTCKKILQIQQPIISNNYIGTTQPLQLKTQLVSGNENKKPVPMLITKSDKVPTKLTTNSQNSIKFGWLTNKTEQSSNLNKRQHPTDKTRLIFKKQFSCTPYFKHFDKKIDETAAAVCKKFKGPLRSNNIRTLNPVPSGIGRIPCKTEKLCEKPVKKLLISKNFKLENTQSLSQMFTTSNKYKPVVENVKMEIEDDEDVVPVSPVVERPGPSNRTIVVRNLKLENINKPITIYQKQRRVPSLIDNSKRYTSENFKQQTKINSKMANANANATIVRENSKQRTTNIKNNNLTSNKPISTAKSNCSTFDINRKSTQQTNVPHIFVGKDNKYKLALPTSVPQNSASKPVYIITDLPITCNTGKSDK